MFGLPFSLLNSQVISELLWKTKEEPHLQVAFVKRLLIAHSLSDGKINKALPSTR